MNALPLVILAVVLSLGTQPPPAPKPAPTPPKPSQPPPKKPETVSVEIVVGTQANLAAACKKGAQPSTIFVVNPKQVFHCIGNTLHDHANHGKNPDMEKAVVRVSAGDRVRWYSTTRFFVASIERHEVPSGSTPPKKNLAPNFPFAAAFPKEYRTEVISSPVRDEPGTIVQRYKASFNIEGVGLVDPDLICSM
jgi:hypothetical protein